MTKDQITTGSIWRSKRKNERHRKILILSIRTSCPRTFNVARSVRSDQAYRQSSRAVREETLLKDYEYLSGGSLGDKYDVTFLIDGCSQIEAIEWGSRMVEVCRDDSQSTVTLLDVVARR